MLRGYKKIMQQSLNIGETSKDKEKEVIKMKMWHRVLVGFAGGILFTCGIWFFTTTQDIIRVLAFIPILFGILAVIYGRFG